MYIVYMYVIYTAATVLYIVDPNKYYVWVGDPEHENMGLYVVTPKACKSRACRFVPALVRRFRKMYWWIIDRVEKKSGVYDLRLAGLEFWVCRNHFIHLTMLGPSLACMFTKVA